MSRVLLIEKDPELRSPVRDILCGGGHSVSTKENLDDSLKELENFSFDIVLSELSEDIGLVVLRKLARYRQAPAPIVMSSEACSTQCQEAERLGAVCVLHHPISPEELMRAVRKAEDCVTGFHGKVHGFSLVDLLQVFHYGRRSVSIFIADRASVHLSEGEVIHAAFDDETGQDALREILLLKSGAMLTEPLVDVPRTISRSFQSLLLDALRECDESEREPKIEGDVEDPFGFGDLLESIEPPERVQSLRPPETARSRTMPPLSNLLNAACAQLVDRVELGLGAAVVDLHNQRILGMHWLGEFEFTDIVDGTLGMLGSNAMFALDECLSGEQPQSANLFEFRAASSHFLHFAKRLDRDGSALVLLAERGANPGLCWAELRRSVPAMERALP